MLDGPTASSLAEKIGGFESRTNIADDGIPNTVVITRA